MTLHHLVIGLVSQQSNDRPSFTPLRTASLSKVRVPDRRDCLFSSLLSPQSRPRTTARVSLRQPDQWKQREKGHGENLTPSRCQRMLAVVPSAASNTSNREFLAGVLMPCASQWLQVTRWKKKATRRPLTRHQCITLEWKKNHTAHKSDQQV